MGRVGAVLLSRSLHAAEKCGIAGWVDEWIWMTRCRLFCLRQNSGTTGRGSSRSEPIGYARWRGGYGDADESGWTRGRKATYLLQVALTLLSIREPRELDQLSDPLWQCFILQALAEWMRCFLRTHTLYALSGKDVHWL